MRLTNSLLLQALVGAACVAATPAQVYLLPSDNEASPAQSVSGDEFDLILAQRMGTSQSFDLADASENVLKHINQFGRPSQELFVASDEEPPHVAIVLETLDLVKELAHAMDYPEPNLIADHLTSLDTYYKAAKDSGAVEERRSAELKKYVMEIESNGYSSSKIAPIFHLDTVEPWTKDLLTTIDKLARNNRLQATIITISPSKSAKTHLRRNIEEPMTDAFVAPSPFLTTTTSKKPAYAPIHGIVASCFASLDSCQSSTNNCSGHGACFKKSGSSSSDSADDSCYTCGCVPTIHEFQKGGETRIKTTYWAGAACSKKDVSAQFWLLAGFSVFLVGLASWGVGMLFAIGEEKLPGVIGAGVSNARAK